MKKALSLTLAMTAALAAPHTMAEETETAVSGNVALASNYIWRGQTQTLDEPAISGGFDVAHPSGLYAGVWGSNVDFGTDDNMEIDYYGGYAGEAGALGYDIGYIDYNYPGGSGDFEEWYLGLSTRAGAVDLGLTYSFGVNAAADNVELSAETELGGVGLGLTAGDYDTNGKYYGVSLSKEVAGLELSLAWSEYDADAGSASDQDDVTFTVARSF